MIPEKKSQKQKITIVGTGNVANLVAALLVMRNRELPKEERVEISILGRDPNSDSFKMMKDRGIKLYCKNPDDGRKIIEVEPRELHKITTDLEDIGEQDHIFVTTKSYSYSVPFFKNLGKLKKKSPEVGNETTVILAQNGIPCWFLSHTKLSNFSLESVDPFHKLLDAIKLQNIVGCVLNLACNSQVNEDGLIVYNLYTAIGKIGMPIGSPDNSKKNNIVNLKLMLSKAGFDVATRGVGISEEVLLKLQVNSAVNALTTMFDCTIGHLLDNPSLKKVVEKLALEVNSIAKALSNIELREGRRLDDRLSLSREHITSTRSDFVKGNPIEISLYRALIEIRSHLSLASTSVETTESVINILEKLISNRDAGMTPDQARESIKQDLDNLVDYVGLSYRPNSPLSSTLSPTLTPVPDFLEPAISDTEGVPTPRAATAKRSSEVLSEDSSENLSEDGGDSKRIRVTQLLTEGKDDQIIK